MSEIPVYDIPLLENLEPVICPRCGGGGRRAHLPMHIPLGEGPISEEELARARGEFEAALREPCDLCYGERRIWRIRRREATG